MIQAGQTVQFKPEWQDAGDQTISFVAIENENGGRVKVRAMLGLAIDPIQVVTVEMIKCAS